MCDGFLPSRTLDRSRTVAPVVVFVGVSLNAAFQARQRTWSATRQMIGIGRRLDEPLLCGCAFVLCARMVQPALASANNISLGCLADAHWDVDRTFRAWLTSAFAGAATSHRIIPRSTPGGDGVDHHRAHLPRPTSCKPTCDIERRRLPGQTGSRLGVRGETPLHSTGDASRLSCVARRSHIRICSLLAP